MYETLLSKLFSPQSVAASFALIPPIYTRVMDDIYPANTRSNYDSPLLPYEEIVKVAKAVPLIRRGAPSTPLPGGSGKFSFVEPQPADVSIPIKATEMNNLKALSPTMQKNWVARQVQFGRDSVRLTAEALCCQTLGGTISYPMRTESGAYTVFELNFGGITEIIPDKKWDDASATLMTIFDTLSLMNQTLVDNGYGQQTEFRAGRKVMSFLSQTIAAFPNDKRISGAADKDVVILNGYRIKGEPGRYQNPQTGAFVDAISDYAIHAIDVKAGHRFFYMAIDDIDAGLMGMPLFVTYEKKKDPSGYKVIMRSTPFPIPVVKAMCKATVLTEP